jgi:2',3'-cyclic-nucleotide 2'-phosphodiesterase (5'-nucleotidase family)
VNGPRRVKNILVLQKGEYVPLDDEKEYTVSSNNFLFAGGDGVNMFEDDPKVETKPLTDYQVLISYIADHLKGKLKEQYAEPQGRITIL